MAYRGRRRRSASYGSRSFGHERALQHIREGEALSRELGGTDKDVKDYFFRLSGSEREQILRLYGDQYGADKREYAEKALPEWRSGKKKMSGMVAERLFNLLPPRMPISAKFDLVKSLWDHVCPQTRKVFWFGPDVAEGTIKDHVHKHVDGTIQHHFIGSPMQARFKWLSGGDVGVQQQLHNHLRDIEKSMVVDALRIQLPPILGQIRNQGGITNQITHHISFGKHRVELHFHPKATGVTEDRTPAAVTGGGSNNWGWVLAAIAAAIVLFLIMRR